MLENLLHSLGFHKNEVTVYLALFALGKTKAGNIITRTGLHRNLVYSALESFMDRGLVTKTIVKGVAQFVANDPARLVEEIEEKKQLAKETAKLLKERQQQTPREVQVYEGEEGIKRSREKTLLFPSGETLYVLGSKASSTRDMESYWRRFHKKREEKGIPLKMLYERGVDPADVAWRNRLEKSEARYLPFQTDMPVWMSFIHDYLEIGIPGNNPLVFGIKSKEAVEGFKAFFSYFWRQEVMVTTGYDALHEAFYGMIDELKEGEEYFVIGGTPGPYVEETVPFFDAFHRERIRRRITANLLSAHEVYDTWKKKFPALGDPQFQYSKFKKFISAAPQPFQINLYQGKTRMVLYSKEPVVISFDRKEFFDGFKTYFDALWMQTK